MKTCALRACHCRHYPSTSGKRPRLASTMTSAEGRCHVMKGCRGKTAWRGWSQTSLSLSHTSCLHVICDCLHCNTSRGSERELMSCLAGKPVKTLISNRVRTANQDVVAILLEWCHVIFIVLHVWSLTTVVCHIQKNIFSVLYNTCTSNNYL